MQSQLIDFAFEGLEPKTQILLKMRDPRRVQSDPVFITQAWHRKAENLMAQAIRVAETENRNCYFSVSVRKILIDPVDGSRLSNKASFAYSKFLWVDLDRDAASLERFILPPSFLVNSGRNYHAYWAVKAPIRDANFLLSANRKLAEQLGETTVCAEVTHVLRVPGTVSYKDDTEYLTAEVITRPTLQYEVQDLIKAMTIAKSTVKRAYEELDKGSRSERDWAVVNDLVKAGVTDETIQYVFTYLPCADKTAEMGPSYLERTISRAREMIKATPALSIQTTPTGRIKIKSSATPVGSAALGSNSADLRAAREVDELLAADAVEVESVTATVDEAVTDAATLNLLDAAATAEQETSFHARSEYDGLNIFRSANSYYKHTAKEDEDKKISTFAFNVIARQQSSAAELNLSTDPALETGGAYIVDVVTDTGREWSRIVLPFDAFSGRDRLQSYLTFGETSWLGSDADVFALRAFLHLQWTDLGEHEQHVTNQLGYFEIAQQGFLATSEGVFNTDGTPSQTITRHSRQTEQPRIHSYNPSGASTRVSPEKAGLILKDMLLVNKPAVTYPALGWWIASALKPQLLKQLQVRFPHLMLHGTRGAGKTSYVTQILQPLSGYKDRQTWSSRVTRFVSMILMGSTTSIPVCFTEFRNGSVGAGKAKNEDLQQLLRVAYDAGQEARGRADQTTQTYRLTAPLCIDGEEPFTDPALQERTLSIYMDVNDNRDPKYRAAFERVSTEPISDVGQMLLAYCYQLDVRELHAEASKLAKQTRQLVGSTRISSNIDVAVMGLLILCRFYAEALKQPCPFELTSASIANWFTPMVEEVESIGGRTRLTVDDFVQSTINAVLAFRAGQPASFQFRAEIKDQNLVWFQLSGAYAAWVRARGASMELFSEAAIKKQLRELQCDADSAEPQAGQYVAHIKQMQTTGPGKEFVRMYAIDLSLAAKSGLDVPERLETVNFSTNVLPGGSAGLPIRTRLGGPTAVSTAVES